VDAGGAHFGQPGYETDLLYLAALVALVIGGSGPLALDAALLGGRNRRVQPQPLSAGQERKEIISDNGLRWR
jgi:hypothetical protein